MEEKHKTIGDVNFGFKKSRRLKKSYWAAPGAEDLQVTIPLNRILEVVSKIEGITIDNLKSRKRHMEIKEARHMYNALARKHTKNSLFNIGRIINRDHATVIHSENFVKDMCETDKDFAARYKRVESIIESFDTVSYERIG